MRERSFLAGLRRYHARHGGPPLPAPPPPTQSTVVKQELDKRKPAKLAPAAVAVHTGAVALVPGAAPVPLRVSEAQPLRVGSAQYVTLVPAPEAAPVPIKSEGTPPAPAAAPDCKPTPAPTSDKPAPEPAAEAPRLTAARVDMKALRRQRRMRTLSETKRSLDSLFG